MPSTIRNEIGRVAIRLPDDATLYRSPHFLAVAIEETTDGTAAYTLLTSPQSLGYHASYDIFHQLCRDRAQATVDEQLVVEGRPVTPERYLKLWRTAIAEPVTAEQFAARCGLMPTARLSAPLPLVRGKKRTWTTSPFDTFDDFEAVYAERMMIWERPETFGFRLELPLHLPNAARDAFYGASFFPFKDRDENHVRIETYLQPWVQNTRFSFAAQADLFGTEVLR